MLWGQRAALHARTQACPLDWFSRDRLQTMQLEGLYAYQTPSNPAESSRIGGFELSCLTFFGEEAVEN